MRETDDEGSPGEERVSPNVFHQLQQALNLLTKAKAKHSPHVAVICSICHRAMTLESKGICADEHGRFAHTDCYVQRVISSTKRPVASEKQAVKSS